MHNPMIKMRIKRAAAAVLLAACFGSSSLLSCAYPRKRPAAPSRLESMENRYFTLDFADSSLTRSDLAKHFFTTFPHNDPTQGDVVYDRKKWLNKDLIDLVAGDGLYLYIKARQDDHLFDSFRLTTKACYNLNRDNTGILFVFKGKFPSGKGIWPAWWLNGSNQDSWTYRNTERVVTDADLDRLSGQGHFYDTPSAVNGTDWPAAGEIDIIETINGSNIIHNTIHACPQMCDSEWNHEGEIINCANAQSTDPNAGCSGKPYEVDHPEGTFACLWESDAIRFYYWTPDGDVRKDGGPLSQTPCPDQWTDDVLKNQVQLLETETTCDSELHQQWQCSHCDSSTACIFLNLKMIFNVTLCGKWAGREFDATENALQNCRSYIVGEGKERVHDQYIKIEYVSVTRIEQN